MLKNLVNFDPVTFLGIDISSMSEQDINDLRTSLNKKIGEYVLLKLSDSLTSEQVDDVISMADGEQIINKLQNQIPDVEQKIIGIMDNFKIDYHIIK